METAEGIKFTTQPTQPPLIIAGPFVTEITDQTALVQWQTDKPASSGVNYGTSNPPGSTLSTPGACTAHNVVLTGLSPYTTYYANVFSTDLAGNGPTSSGILSFRTLSQPNLQPPVILEGPIITSINNHSATVEWTTDKPADSVIDYGIGEALNLRVSDATLTTDHQLTLVNLQPGQSCSFAVSSTDLNGLTTV
jgi:hypothetical protein